MNIVFGIFKYFPHGGLQRDMMRIAEELVRRGDRVTVFCHHWDDDTPVPEGITVKTLTARGWSNHARAESFIRHLGEELKSFPHDVFVAFNRIPGADFYFAADNPFYSTAIRNVGKLGARLLPRYRTFIAEERGVFAPEAKTVVMYLTPRQKDEYTAIYHTPEARFKLLPPGIPADRKRPPEDEADARRRAKREELGVGDGEGHDGRRMGDDHGVDLGMGVEDLLQQPRGAAGLLAHLPHVLQVLRYPVVLARGSLTRLQLLYRL